MQTTLPLNTMTVSEKLRIMEEIWDDLCRLDGAIPAPDWHQDALGKREHRADSGQSRFVDLDDAKRRVRGLTR
jgi:hypothetical protein